jgi:antitoxin component YwqK of YwqJK toxin-antitoxin module
MAMAIMAHRAPFRNSFYAVFIFLLSCDASQENSLAIPAVYISAKDKALQQSEGFLYHNDKKFFGWIYDLYSNGDTSLLISYADGKEEGWCRKWYDGKKPMEERFYIRGKKEGAHKAWWPDGQLKFYYLFSNDEHNGEAKEWFSNGKPYRIFNYKQGYEEGLQKMWWEDGRVRANYVVRGGQQYGLIGRKLCRNNDSTKIN